MATELELATTDALCDELLNRFEHMVIVGLTERNDGDLTELRHQQGNSRTCQGLLLGCIFRIEHDLEERTFRDEND